jgi:nitrate reductase / nitrite oxidoreductase, alpha subunit
MGVSKRSSPERSRGSGQRGRSPLLEAHVEQLGTSVKGASWVADEEVSELGAQNGAVRGGSADGRPSLERVEQACEAILALSGTTNGRLAVEGFRSMEHTTGVELADLAGPRSGDRITFQDAQVQPRTLITSPEWSGIEAHGRRYSPFTMNVEREKPWHTLSGRQHLYVDHAWMLELGEGCRCSARHCISWTPSARCSWTPAVSRLAR